MTPEEFKLKIEALAFTLSSKAVKNDLLIQGGKDLEGRMKQRIFNDGQASSGRAIGKYKAKSWIKKRKDDGLQVAYVDLEFTGELRKSIQVLEDGEEIVLAIINDEDYAKATGQEKRRKRKIFEPTQKEIEKTQKYINDLIEEEIDQILQNL